METDMVRTLVHGNSTIGLLELFVGIGAAAAVGTKHKQAYEGRHTMFYNRLERLERMSQLEQIIAAMPAYPIYRESECCYSIYIQGARHIYASEAEAQMSQLRARASWLRAHDGLSGLQ
jgi:hypothetical protein